MPLKITIKYDKQDDPFDKYQDFFISHDGTIESPGFDYEYWQTLSALAGGERDDRIEFVDMFTDGGALALLEDWEFLREFCDAIHEQGIEAFADGDQIPADEEFRIMTEVLRRLYYSETFDIKDDIWICKRIAQTIGPDDVITVNTNIERNIPTEYKYESRSEITYQLKINDTEIREWQVDASKFICDALTFQICFEVDKDTEVPEEDDDTICKALGIEFPKEEVDESYVNDPVVPKIDPRGKYLLLYTFAEDPISPSSAEKIHRFSSSKEAKFAADLSTDIWVDHEESEYKITLAKLVPSKSKQQRTAQRSLFSGRQIGRKPVVPHDELQLICTWVDQGTYWVKIDHQKDDEITRENMFD